MGESHLSDFVGQCLTPFVRKVLDRALVEIIRLHVEVTASLHSIIGEPRHVLRFEQGSYGSVKFLLIIVAKRQP